MGNLSKSIRKRIASKKHHVDMKLITFYLTKTLFFPPKSPRQLKRRAAKRRKLGHGPIFDYFSGSFMPLQIRGVAFRLIAPLAAAHSKLRFPVVPRLENKPPYKSIDAILRYIARHLPDKIKIPGRIASIENPDDLRSAIRQLCINRVKKALCCAKKINSLLIVKLIACCRRIMRRLRRSKLNAIAAKFIIRLLSKALKIFEILIIRDGGWEEFAKKCNRNAI